MRSKRRAGSGEVGNSPRYSSNRGDRAGAVNREPRGDADRAGAAARAPRRRRQAPGSSQSSALIQRNRVPRDNSSARFMFSCEPMLTRFTCRITRWSARAYSSSVPRSRRRRRCRRSRVRGRRSPGRGPTRCSALRRAPVAHGQPDRERGWSSGRDHPVQGWRSRPPAIDHRPEPVTADPDDPPADLRREPPHCGRVDPDTQPDRQRAPPASVDADRRQALGGRAGRSRPSRATHLRHRTDDWSRFSGKLPSHAGR